MANWTSPHIWSVAEEATSPLFNQHQRDNLQYLYDRFVLLSASGSGSAGLTLTTGIWLLLATFNPTTDPVNCRIGSPAGTQVEIVTYTSDAKAPSLVWSAVVSAASENWAAVGGGTVRFFAVRVAV
jgi:hypothetical protein